MMLSALVGCERGPQRVPIKGTVTYQGKPVDAGSMTFVPSDADKNTMEGATISGGKYEFAPGKGLFPGTYQVSISAPADKASAPATAAPGAPRRSREGLPERYNTNTTLSIEVTPTGARDFDFKLE